MDHSANNNLRGSRFEISTNTPDPSLQLTFADPYGSLTQLGLAIPSAIPAFYTNLNTPYANRYLFLLATAQFSENEVVRLVGIRQRVLIGMNVPGFEGTAAYPIYQAVQTPEWHFTDGNVSWHLRRTPLNQGYRANQYNASALAYRSTDTPALLFENPPGVGNGYGPPNGGRPPGDPFIPELSNFHDIRFPWLSGYDSWNCLDVEVRGPCAIQLYASVQQTNPSTRTTLNLNGVSDTNLVIEERFIQDWPNSVYTKIAGSLIFERPNLYPVPQEVDDCDYEPPGALPQMPQPVVLVGGRKAGGKSR